MNAQVTVVRDPPAWSAAMEAGFWYRISGDAPDLGLPRSPPGTRYLADNDPALDPALNPPVSARERLRRLLGRPWIAPWSGRVGFSSITEAWNGAAYASGLGRAGSMIVFGGGHNDYFGSDVHAFDLECRQWRRLSTGFVTGEPSEYGDGAVYPDSVYPDGSPLPPHTYGYVQYDAVGNNFLLLKGQIELGPNVKAVAIPHLFSLDTMSWNHGPRNSEAILSSGGFTTWDEKRRILWGHSGDDGGGNAFVGYSPDGFNADGSTGSWRELFPNKLPGEANHNAMQFHPGIDRIIFAVHTRDALMSIDPSHPSAPLAPLTAHGARPTIQPYCALEYSSSLDSLVYFSAVDGGAVYGIEWQPGPRWYRINEASSLDPIADAASQSRCAVNLSHTFGRFRIARFSEFDLAVLIRHIDSAVYSMRLPC